MSNGRGYFFFTKGKAYSINKETKHSASVTTTGVRMPIPLKARKSIIGTTMDGIATINKIGKYESLHFPPHSRQRGRHPGISFFSVVIVFSQQCGHLCMNSSRSYLTDKISGRP